MPVVPFSEFVSQRVKPKMCRIFPTIDRDKLHVEADGMRTLTLPLQPVRGNYIQATVWKTPFECSRQSKESCEWFSHFLETECWLVATHPETMAVRTIDHGRKMKLACHDSSPVTGLSEASFNHLATAVQRRERILRGANALTSLSVDRFRSNLVYEGLRAFGEERGKGVIIGGYTALRFRKLVPRCAIINVDQQTGERHPHNEPFGTLNCKEYRDTRRQTDEKIPLFGVYYVPFRQGEVQGEIKVGDRVEIV